MAKSQTKKIDSSTQLGFEAERWLIADISDIDAHGHVLTSGSCVGAEQVENDREPLEEKRLRLVTGTHVHFVRFAKLEAVVMTNLKRSGHGR